MFGDKHTESVPKEPEVKVVLKYVQPNESVTVNVFPFQPSPHESFIVSVNGKHPAYVQDPSSILAEGL